MSSSDRFCFCLAQTKVQYFSCFYKVQDRARYIFNRYFGINAMLVQKINAFLKAYREKGGFDELGEKWLKEQKAAFKERGVPFVF